MKYLALLLVGCAAHSAPTTRYSELPTWDITCWLEGTVIYQAEAVKVQFTPNTTQWIDLATGKQVAMNEHCIGVRVE